VTLEPDICYRALTSRDARFDGRFFTAVKTTGIYCRPICPARAPLRKNVEFYACAAAAQEAGYRPCLRCRPETSPGTPAWAGTSATVSRALRLIGEGALDSGGVTRLANRLGIGPRHLRRLFTLHLGAPPLAVAQTRRLHFARRLICETSTPMTQVALASGFSSIRRFNAAFLAAHDCSPSSLRRRSSPGAGLVLRLTYRPPYDWPFVVGFLAARAIPGVETVEASVYRRTVRLDGVEGVVSVRSTADQLVVEMQLSDTTRLIQLVERIRRLFDLQADPAAISQTLANLSSRPGLRVPGAFDGFETAIRAILGQQISVKGATTLSGRIVQAFGDPVDQLRVAGLTHHFPSASTLADADLSQIGLTGKRIETIHNLSTAVRDRRLTLDGATDLDSAIEQLTAIPGIGPWTAHYIAMRVLGEPDAFPAADLGLRKAAAPGAAPLSAAALGRLAEAWRPWRAYAAIALWSGGSPQ